MNSNRRKKLLTAITGNEDAPGLELGPLHEPVALKVEQNVRYIDRMSHAELVEHYRPQGVDVEQIVPLDYVWEPGKRLDECVSNTRFAYCLASHVIEHVPNLVGWLNDVASVLQPGGILSLAIPNQPHTFDRQRPLTTTAEVVEAHIHNNTQPSPQQVYCHFRNNVDHNNNNTETPEFALHAAQQAAAGVYVDVHCWVFTSASFHQVIDELALHNLTKFRPLNHDEDGGEFFSTLVLSN